MKTRILAIVPVFALILSGCYHTMITTGKAPSDKVIDKPWAMSFVAGLVPPEELDVAEDCPNGVAIVETELSFMNLLVSAITFNIVSPMHLTVTCAAGGMAADDDVRHLDLATGSDSREIQAVFQAAAEISKSTGERVQVRFVE